MLPKANIYPLQPCTLIKCQRNRNCGRLLERSSPIIGILDRSRLEKFNKVILTYFTPLSSCGNSLTLVKSSNMG